MDNNNQLNKCYSLIKNHDTAVIATSSRASEPHASVVNYFMNEAMEIFFIAREDAQKFKNITNNPLTCLVVCTANFSSSVEIKGAAHQLEDNAKTTNLLIKYSEVIRRRNPGPLPIMKYPGSELFLFKMMPHMMTYADFNTSSNVKASILKYICVQVNKVSFPRTA